VRAREVLVALVAFALLTAALFSEVTFGGATVASAPHIPFTLPEGPVGYAHWATIPLIDPYGPGWIHEANFRYRDAAIRHWEAPLWHPYEACGNPYLAGLLPGLFFPTNWLMHAAEPPLGFDLAYLARLVLAGWFTYLFLRVHRLRRAAAGIGGLLYLGTGYLLLSLNLSNAAVEACVPGLLLGLERLLAQGRLRDRVLAAAMIFLVLAGGNPQATFLALLLGGGYAAARLAARQLAARRGRAASPALARSVLDLAVVHVAAALLAAPQYGPFLEFVARAAHLHPPGLAMSTQPWQTFVQWIAPGFFEHALDPAVPSRNYYFFGAAPLALGVAALGAGGPAFLRRFVLGGFAVTAAWYFGLPGFRHLGALPGASQILIGKYLGVYLCLFAALLAALGLDRLLARPTRGAALRLGLGALLVAGILATFVALWHGGGLAGIARDNLRVGPGDPVQPHLGSAAWVLPLLGLMAGLLAWRPDRRRPIVAAIALVVAGAVYHDRPGPYPPRQPLYEPPAFLAALKGDPLAQRIYSPDLVLAPNTATAFGLRDIRYAEALKIRRYADLIVRAFGYPDAGNYFPMRHARPGVPVHALSLLGVRYCLSQDALMPLAPPVLAAGATRRGALDLREAAGRLTGTLEAPPGEVTTVRVWRIDPADVKVVAAATIAPSHEEHVFLRAPGERAGDRLFSVGLRSSTPATVEITSVAWNGRVLDPGALLPGAHRANAARIEGAGLLVTTPNVLGLPGADADAPAELSLRVRARTPDRAAVEIGLVSERCERLATVGPFQGGAGVPRREPVDFALESWRGQEVVLAVEVSGLGRLHGFGFQPDGLELRGRFDRIEVHENLRALPRAFGVHAADVIADEAAALEQLLDPTFPCRERVILPAAPPGGLRLPAEPPSRPPRVEVRREAPGGARLELRASFEADGFLVLHDNHYPGWRATVNGSPAPICRANHTFRAVPVPAGEHTVVFTFAPASWRIGWAVAPGGLLLLAAAGLRRPGTRRRRPPG